MHDDDYHDRDGDDDVYYGCIRAEQEYLHVDMMPSTWEF